MVMWTFEFSAICFFHNDCTAKGESYGDRESAGRATTAGDAASLLDIPILPFSLAGHCGMDILKDHHESVECVASIARGKRWSVYQQSNFLCHLSFHYKPLNR